MSACLALSEVWEPRLCDSCGSPEERDELEHDSHDRLVRACQTKGGCKWLRNNPIAEQNNLFGNPEHFSSASSVTEALKLFASIENLSPIDQFGPRMDALGWLDWEIPVEPMEFVEWLSLYVQARRNAHLKAMRVA